MRPVRPFLFALFALGACHATRPPGEALFAALAAEPARAARLAPAAATMVAEEASRVPSLEKTTAVLLPSRPVSAQNEILRTWAALFGTRAFARAVGAHDADESLGERVGRRLRL